MLAGLFRNSGLFMGDSFYLCRDANPLGFFEDREVNAINEALLFPLLPSIEAVEAPDFCRDLPREGQLWLARFPLSARVNADLSLKIRIRNLYERGPSCLKDPRFCFTLEAWRQVMEPPEAEQARFLCVFRHPSIVATSIMKEVRTAPYLASLAISVQQVFANWQLSYLHILEHHRIHGHWLFVPYDSLFTTNGLDRVEAFTEMAIDRGFPTPQLNRSSPEIPADPASLSLYDQLMSMGETIT